MALPEGELARHTMMKQGQWQIFYQIFLQDKDSFTKVLEERCQRAIDTIRWVCKVEESQWYEFFDTLTTAEKRANKTSIVEGIFTADDFTFERFFR